jgi:hypothetical protein
VEIILSTLALTLLDVIPIADAILMKDSLQSFDRILIILRSFSSKKSR